MQCACAILSPLAYSAVQYFSTLSQNGRIFGGKKVTEYKMCVLITPTTFVGNISHSKKNWARNDKMCLQRFTRSTHYSCQILMKLEYSWQIFEKYSNIKFYVNLVRGSRVVSWGRTDGRTDMMKLIVAFPNFANAPSHLSWPH